MQPVTPPESITVWVLSSLSTTGSMTMHTPSSYSGGVFPGYFIRLEDAQQEQMLLALKGQKSHVFQLDFPRP
jgi:hypothetical protein